MDIISFIYSIADNNNDKDVHSSVSKPALKGNYN